MSAISPATSLEETAPRELLVDPEHLGIRVFVPLIAFGSFILGFVLFSILTSVLQLTSIPACIGVVIGLLVAVGVTAFTERNLKRRWRSGRSLVLDAESAMLEDKRRGREKQIRLLWNQRINPLLWRFRLSRQRGRIQKGWFMLGIKLIQDDNEMILYSFLAEKDAVALPIYQHFKALATRAELDSDKMGLREKTEQRRLLKAEHERWEDGAELTTEDFVLFANTLHQRLTTWQADAEADD